MNFVNDVDFVFAKSRHDHGFFTKFADIVDTSEGGGIDFNDINIGVFKLIVEMVNFVGKNTSDRGFATAAWTNKEVGMRNFTLD